MTDDQTLKLSPIFNRCLLDLEAIGNFDFLSSDREQAMQILMEMVDAAAVIINNTAMDSIDVEIGKLEDRVVEAAISYRAMKVGTESWREAHVSLVTVVDELLAAREKAEQRLTPTSC